MIEVVMGMILTIGIIGLSAFAYHAGKVRGKYQEELRILNAINTMMTTAKTVDNKAERMTINWCARHLWHTLGKEEKVGVA